MTIESTVCCPCSCNATIPSCQFASSYYASPITAGVFWTYVEEPTTCNTGVQCWSTYRFSMAFQSITPIVMNRFQSGSGGCSYRGQFGMRAQGIWTREVNVYGTGSPSGPGNNGTQVQQITVNNSEVEACLVLNATCIAGCCNGPVPVLRWGRQLAICNFRMGVANGISSSECFETGFADPDPDAVFLACTGGNIGQRSDSWGDPSSMNWVNCGMPYQMPNVAGVCFGIGGICACFPSDVEYADQEFAVKSFGQSSTLPENCHRRSQAPPQSVNWNGAIGISSLVGTTASTAGNPSCGNSIWEIPCPFGIPLMSWSAIYNYQFSGGNLS